MYTMSYKKPKIVRLLLVLPSSRYIFWNITHSRTHIHCYSTYVFHQCKNVSIHMITLCSLYSNSKHPKIPADWIVASYSVKNEILFYAKKIYVTNNIEINKKLLHITFHDSKICMVTHLKFFY